MSRTAGGTDRSGASSTTLARKLYHTRTSKGAYLQLPSSRLTEANKTLIALQLSMVSKWSENGSIPVLHPRCETVSSKTMPLKPASMQGWELVNRNDKKSYEATEPGSIIVSMAHNGALDVITKKRHRDFATVLQSECYRRASRSFRMENA